MQVIAISALTLATAVSAAPFRLPESFRGPTWGTCSVYNRYTCTYSAYDSSRSDLHCKGGDNFEFHFIQSKLTKATPFSKPVRDAPACCENANEYCTIIATGEKISATEKELFYPGEILPARNGAKVGLERVPMRHEGLGQESGSAASPQVDPIADPSVETADDSAASSGAGAGPQLTRTDGFRKPADTLIPGTEDSTTETVDDDSSASSGAGSSPRLDRSNGFRKPADTQIPGTEDSTTETVDDSSASSGAGSSPRLDRSNGFRKPADEVVDTSAVSDADDVETSETTVVDDSSASSGAGSSPRLDRSNGFRKPAGTTVDNTEDSTPDTNSF